MKRAVITGASGFVGACLARRLLQDGHEVHALVRPGFQPWRLAAILDQLHLHHSDLLDFDRLARQVAEIRPDWVFHLATYGAYSSQTGLSQALQTNIQGTVNLVEACRQGGFEAFINTGSSSEYGFKTHPARETDWLEPNSYYAVTKAAATMFCRYTAQKTSLKIPTLRLYSVYGPYEEPARFIPALIKKGLEKKLPPLVNPATARDYVYVDDVVEAYMLAAGLPAQEPGAIFNVGTGQQTSILEAVEIARRVLAIEETPRWGTMPDRQWDSAVWVADNTKIRQQLNWQPRYSFEEGFRRTVAWFEANPEMLSFYRQSNNLPG